MRFLTLCATLLGVSTTVNALPSPADFEIQAWRAWDFRLLSEAPPICNASESNLQFSIAHRYGQKARACQALETDYYNSTNVKSISWKSPGDSYPHDICFFATYDCAPESFLSTITNGWDVCYLYNGFLGWSVVAKGDPCVAVGGEGSEGGEGVDGDVDGGEVEDGVDGDSPDEE
ncbi:uncharacterized protein N7515_007973 [Penicillium bovifimosum]|uniref:Uncharacterized protein n=1 Tax=Penicillium bovifimosum TaxID=126998 RepID=A0A9W9KXE0_9EURO|nr:uncharacterized protein N7515_007973 [Penicillium bovifimosum]KAJ5124148.1 hypothetical protein N7515_007973 [Penicillium bovifimosum]